MSLWRWLRRGAGNRQPRGSSSEDTEYLHQWARARVGVEAYVEPRTMVTETTVVLVAQDGEWTRRRVNGPEGARKLGRALRIPVYDAQIVGYPKRMRDYEARRRILRDRARRDELGDTGT